MSELGPDSRKNLLGEEVDTEIIDETGTGNQGVDEEKKVHPRNALNELSAKEWIPETISVWTQRGLGAKHPDAQIERQHPAPFSFTDVARLIRFFTKSGEVVLDPFVGVGSTLKACALENRRGVGFELNPEYARLAKERLTKEVRTLWAQDYTQEVLVGDARDLAAEMEADTVDFVVTSPPYWSILHKEDHKAKQERITYQLDTKYGSDERDLGNIHDYREFLEDLSSILGECGRILKLKRYMAVIVSDFRDNNYFARPTPNTQECRILRVGFREDDFSAVRA